MHLYLSIAFVLSSLFFISCGNSSTSASESLPAAKTVSIVQIGDSAVLLRQGRPYFIQGAGGQSRLSRLKECGGNSVRIWDDSDADRVLNQADQLGLTVLFGLWVEREIDGFDYYDQQALDEQYDRIRKVVLQYRNHPALLMWCLGNEWNLKARNINVYDEINRLAKMIHELDPNHPVTTAIGSNRSQTFKILQDRCPEIDVLGINVYGEMYRLRERLQQGGWTGPYLISEFGPLGHWESEVTDWRAPIEPPSHKKSEFVQTLYQNYIASRPPNCLGSYVFLWGTKEEGTHTWYSIFDEKGRETALVETMQKLWSGKSAANQAPVIQQLKIDQQDSTFRTFTASGELHHAHVGGVDPDGDSLTYLWEIRPQAGQRLDFDYHDTPLRPIDGLITAAHKPAIAFRLPKSAGEYRLFVYVFDSHRHVASANIPFRLVVNRAATHL